MANGKESIKRRYIAEATARRFHANLSSKIRCVRGPIGSGKSVMCIMELFMRALAQEAGHDGVRRTRFAIVRNSFPELKSTTIKSCQDFLPEPILCITYGSPITGLIKLNLPDGTRVESEWYFMPLDKPRDLGKLLSLELTGAFLNESRQLIKSIIDAVDSRVGRYPGKAHGAPITWNGVIMDTNAPDEKHWYAELERNPPQEGRGWQFYVQPPALIKTIAGDYVPNPDAENAKNQQLGYNYWLEMLGGKDQEWINVYVLNQFGLIIEGQGVYRDFFTPTVHISTAELAVIDKCQVWLGWDFGLTPACIIGQITPLGQVRILKEIVTDRMGIERFVREEVLPVLLKHYRKANKAKPIISVGDPSGTAWDTNERSCFEILDEGLSCMNIRTLPADSNKPTERIESVRFFLSRTIPSTNDMPAMLIDPRCEMIVGGMKGGYHYKIKHDAGSGVTYQNQPNKNNFSHPHDALQYLTLDIKNRYGFKTLNAV
ncbi:MAG: hypothetical protein RPR28_07730 [Cycloclasticus sp.]